MFVFDTSAFINGWNYHYRPPAFDRLWSFVAACMDDGRIIAPRAVLREIQVRTDLLAAWVKDRPFIDPSEVVQRRVGDLRVEHASIFALPGRNDADPWVIALAEEQGRTVVTYEGLQFSGAPARPSRHLRRPSSLVREPLASALGPWLSALTLV